MHAIILAGGKGTRLKPFTTNFPKPLVPIGDMPILEIIIKQLAKSGFDNITLAVNHLADMFVAFFKNGRKFGVSIKYSIEDKMLGTAGPLRLIDCQDDNFLVMNGDILTTLDYMGMYNFHKKENNDVTIATYRKRINIDLGILKLEKGKLKEYIEKPTYSFDVSMGIYIFSREVIKFIPPKEKFDMPDLIKTLIAHNRKVGSFSGDYFWLDIGRVEDYEQAIKIFEKRKLEFLP